MTIKIRNLPQKDEGIFVFWLMKPESTNRCCTRYLGVEQYKKMKFYLYGII